MKGNERMRNCTVTYRDCIVIWIGKNVTDQHSSNWCRRFDFQAQSIHDATQQTPNDTAHRSPFGVQLWYVFSSYNSASKNVKYKSAARLCIVSGVLLNFIDLPFTSQTDLCLHACHVCRMSFQITCFNYYL